jgi:hypothetical protein
MKRMTRFLLLSLLAHVLLFAILSFLPGPPDESRNESVIDITMIRLPDQEKTIRDAASYEKQASVEREDRTAPAAKTGRRRAAGTQPALPETESVAGQQAFVQEPRSGPEDAETEKPPTVIGPDIFTLSYDVLSSSVEQPEDDETGLDKVLGEYFADVTARNKVIDGDYDYSLLKLKSGMEDQWNPEFNEIHTDSFKKVVVKWAKNYKKAAKSYGETGTMPGASAGTGMEDIGGSDKKHAYLLDMYDHVSESGAWTTNVRLVVDLDFDGKGTWSLSVHKPSGHSDFDEEAIDDLSRALNSKELELPNDPVSTRWALEAAFSITPPLPVAGFDFDLAVKKFDLAYPLKKSVTKRITLLAVKVPDTK